MIVVATKSGTGFIEQSAEPAGLQDWFRRMRADEPVSRDEQYGAWHLFRYDDISGVLADPGVFSSDLSGLVPPQEDFELFAQGNFVGMDPPRHDKLRKLVSKAFTPRVVAELEPRISAITGELLDAASGQASFDAVAQLAYPLPITVIAELLGVPATDRDEFKQWADSLLGQPLREKLLPDEAVLKQQGAQVRRMNTYLLAHIRERRAHPMDDLTSTLTAAEVDGERLTDSEIVGFLGLLLIAGHITTTTLLTNTIMCLDEFPQAAAPLRADPSLLPAAMEEVLRYRAPFPRLARLTTANTEVGGVAVPSGQVLNLWIASADHDERAFAEPERFDIGRTPNRHLSFGHGIHFCLGAPLARLEGRIAMAALLDRSRDLAVGGKPDLYDARIMTGARRLPVEAVWV